MSPCGIEPVCVLGQNEPKMQIPWMEDPDMRVLRLWVAWGICLRRRQSHEDGTGTGEYVPGNGS